MVPEIQLDMLDSVLTSVLSVLLSLSLELIPGLQSEWDKFAYKRQIWIGSGLVMVVLMIVMNLVGALSLNLPTPFFWNGFWSVAIPFGSWVASSTVSYSSLKAFGKVNRSEKKNE